jgi:LacI family transcriptional regulator
MRQRVEWLDQYSGHQLTEVRTLRGVLVPEIEGWALRWYSRLLADTRELTISSPAVNGRPGAGYGGVFWRLPTADETHVITPGGHDEQSAHGSRGGWVAFAQRRGDSWVTVVLCQSEPADYPWFVRVADYVGAGPALAWDSPLVIPEGDHVNLILDAIVVDRELSQQDAADLAGLAQARLAVKFSMA